LLPVSVRVHPWLIRRSLVLAAGSRRSKKEGDQASGGPPAVESSIAVHPRPAEQAAETRRPAGRASAGRTAARTATSTVESEHVRRVSASPIPVDQRRAGPLRGGFRGSFGRDEVVPPPGEHSARVKTPSRKSLNRKRLARFAGRGSGRHGGRRGRCRGRRRLEKRGCRGATDGVAGALAGRDDVIDPVGAVEQADAALLCRAANASRPASSATTPSWPAGDHGQGSRWRPRRTGGQFPLWTNRLRKRVAHAGGRS